MSELKIQHILTMAYLLSRGARHNHVAITTSSLGKGIKRSQQAASAHLLELEENRFIERIVAGRKTSVKITARGHAEMERLYTILGKSLNLPSYVELKGTLVSGVGEGAYYMGLSGYKKQFESKIGYVPFPGTLNLRLDQETYRQAAMQLDTLEGETVKGFSDGRRTYGWVRCIPAMLNGRVDCQLIMLERTHHDSSIIELISKACIRRQLGLRDGSKLTVRIPVKSRE